MSKTPMVNEENKSNNSLEQEDNEDFLYTKMEKGGLKYIKHQRNYLIFSALFPIFFIVIQVINFIFIRSLRMSKFPPRPEFRQPLLIDFFTPIFIFLVIFVFTLMNFVFLVSWNKNVHRYEKYQEKIFTNSTVMPNNEFPEEKITLTILFYKIIQNMKIIRIIFIGFNLICAYYFIWFIGFFLMRFGSDTPLYPNIQMVTRLLNIIWQVGLIFYLIFEWRHFYRWNKKLKKLKEFEKKIYKELDI